MESLKKQADKLLGDEEKETIEELLKAVKKQNKDTTGENKELHEKIERLEERLKDGTVKTIDALYTIAGILRDQKVELPEKFQVWVENQIDVPDEVSVRNLKDIKIPKFPSEIDAKEPKWLAKYIKPIVEAVSKLPKLQKVELDDKHMKATKPISVRLSNGRKFYEAMMAVSSGGGGFKQVIIEDTMPTHDSKANESFDLAFDASDNLTRIDMTIQGETYRRTITWTGDNPTAISTWSRV